MDVVIYRAKGKNGYIYDMSINPEIDYGILLKIRSIVKMEILARNVAFETAFEILRKIYENTIFPGNIVNFQGLYFERVLKKYGIEPLRENVSYNGKIPDLNNISVVEDIIMGKVVSLRQIYEILTKEGMKKEDVDNIVQALYVERRIKISPVKKEIKNEKQCMICGKRECSLCSFGFTNDDILLYAADNYNIGEPIEVSVAKRSLSDVHKIAEKGINSFMRSKKQWGVIWSVPHSYEIDIIFDAAASVLKKGGKVLYLTSTMKVNEVKEAFLRHLNPVRVLIGRDLKTSCKDWDIIIGSTDLKICFHKSFDLVIYDSTLSYIERPSGDFIKITQRAVKENGKYLLVSCCKNRQSKNLFPGPFEVIPIPVSENRLPFPEPRFIISRLINGSEAFVPPMVVDLIKWSIEQGLRILIFVPDVTSLRMVYYYLTTIEDFDKGMIETSSENDIEPILKFKRREVNILISMNLTDSLFSLKGVNVIIMNAESSFYKEDTLINISSLAQDHGKGQVDLREVLFVASVEDENMTSAKSMIRSINKIAWEEGYFKM